MHQNDLHIHSVYSSDGELNINNIADKCRATGIRVFSITDHNSVKGIEEAENIATRYEMKFIPGIEIDCNYNGTDLHVLGYHIDGKNNVFKTLEEEINLKVKESFGDMIQNLLKLGFKIDEKSVLKKANGKLPTGELIIEVMLSDEKFYTPLLDPYMEGGEKSKMPYIDFYLDYFSQGKPAYVPVKFMDFKDAIALITNTGGIPVIAHPGLNFKGRENIAAELLEQGAHGLEVFNNYHDLEQICYFAELVVKRNAIMTAGSDFHGKTKPAIGIGQYKSKESYMEYLNGCIQKLLHVGNPA